jgi:hypothetical protein
MTNSKHNNSPETKKVLLRALISLRKNMSGRPGTWLLIAAMYVASWLILNDNTAASASGIYKTIAW